MDIQTRIRQRCIEKGLTQKALAEKVGLKRQAVQHWERPDSKGGSAPSRHRLHLVAKALEVSPEWLQFGALPSRISKKSKKGKSSISNENDWLDSQDSLTIGTRRLIRKLIEVEDLGGLPEHISDTLERVLQIYLEKREEFHYREAEKDLGKVSQTLSK